MLMAPSLKKQTFTEQIFSQVIHRVAEHGAVQCDLFVRSLIHKRVAAFVFVQERHVFVADVGNFKFLTGFKSTFEVRSRNKMRCS